MVGVLFFIVTLGTLGKIVFTIGFSGLSLAFAVFWLLAFHFSQLVVAYLIGRLILQQLAPHLPEASRRIWALVVGVAVYVLATSVPLLGILIWVVAVLVGLGAMWLVFQEWRLTRMKPAAVPAATV